MQQGAMVMSSSSDSEDPKNLVHKVETVPPPPGEDSAYDAPTKVGATAEAVLASMKSPVLMEVQQQAPQATTPIPKPPIVPAVTTSAADNAPTTSGVVPRIRHEEDEDLLVFAKTELMPQALAAAPKQTANPSPQRAATPPIPYPANFVGRDGTAPSSKSPPTWLVLIPILLLIAGTVTWYLRHQ